MFRLYGRVIWLGLHAGQALPVSETLPAGVDPTPKATRPEQSANLNSTGATLNYMLAMRVVCCELKRNNEVWLDDATWQHPRGKL
jgi:hypothetical protein